MGRALSNKTLVTAIQHPFLERQVSWCVVMRHLERKPGRRKSCNVFEREITPSVSEDAKEKCEERKKEGRCADSFFQSHVSCATYIIDARKSGGNQSERNPLAIPPVGIQSQQQRSDVTCIILFVIWRSDRSNDQP